MMQNQQASQPKPANGWLSRLKRALGLAPLERSDTEQAQADQAAARLCLYHYPGCLFCTRVHHTLKRLNLRVPLRDIRADPAARQELLAGGGRAMVPCLRIPTDSGHRWLYESSDISHYLKQRFGATPGS